ncbi:MAG: hypothetical protein ACRD3B_06335 [Candidatus Sulfotelmatobacter sp.]
MQRLCTLIIFLSISLFAQVTTSQYNNARSGATLNEKTLTLGKTASATEPRWLRVL